MHIRRAAVGLLLGLLSLTGCASNFTNYAAKVYGPGYSGSAFLYRGHVVTAGHICDTGDPLRLSRIDATGNEIQIPGEFIPEKFVYGEPGKDACILAGSGPTGLKNTFRAPRLKIGAPISIIGSPWGLSVFRTDGYLASYDALGYLGVSAAAAPGNSGSPVLDSRGRVVGILVAGLTRYEHASLVTPIEEVDKLIDAR